MDFPRKTTFRIAGEAILVLAYFVVATRVVSAWVDDPGLHATPDLRQPLDAVATVVAGGAPVPFRDRLLVPWLVHIANRTTGMPMVQVLVWTQVLFLAAGLFAIRALLRGEIPGLLAALVPLGAAPLTRWLISAPRFPYDFPALALTAACLVAIRRARWRAYAALYPLGFLTRETVALVVVAFAITLAGRVRNRRLIALVALQIVAVLGFKLWMASGSGHAPTLVARDTGATAAHSIVASPTVRQNEAFLRSWRSEGRWRKPRWRAFYPLLGLALWGAARGRRFYRACGIHGIVVAAFAVVFARLAESRVFLDLVPELLALGAIGGWQILRCFGRVFAAPHAAGIGDSRPGAAEGPS